MTAAYFLSSPLRPSGSSSTVTGMVERSKKPRLLLFTVDRDALRSLQTEWALIYAPRPFLRCTWWLMGAFQGRPWENSSAQRSFSDPSAPLLYHLFPCCRGKKRSWDETWRSLPPNTFAPYLFLHVTCAACRFPLGEGCRSPPENPEGANGPGAGRKINSRELSAISAKWDFLATVNSKYHAWKISPGEVVQEWDLFGSLILSVC